MIDEIVNNPTFRVFGWLFGLTGDVSAVEVGGVHIRRMTDVERYRICGHAQDFFVTAPHIWENTTARFPYVFEKAYGTVQPVMGGDDMVAILLSLLSPGEVRTPVAWMEVSTGLASSETSTSAVADYFHRFINARFSPVRLDVVAESFQRAVRDLGERMLQSSHSVFDQYLIDRLFEGKQYTLEVAARSEVTLLARAAETAMVLEYVFNDGSSSEVTHRLGMSVAWLLGSTVSERKSIYDAVKHTYSKRSSRVHGNRNRRMTDEARATSLQFLVESDRLLRRSIVANLVGGYSDKDWVQVFTQARFGEIPQGFDRADWVS